MEIRRSNDRLISTVGFCILARQYLYLGSGLWCLPIINSKRTLEGTYKNCVTPVHTLLSMCCQQMLWHEKMQDIIYNWIYCAIKIRFIYRKEHIPLSVHSRFSSDFYHNHNRHNKKVNTGWISKPAMTPWLAAVHRGINADLIIVCRVIYAKCVFSHRNEGEHCVLADWYEYILHNICMP